MAQELAKNETGIAVVPEYLKKYDGATGTENIGSEDVNIPRLKLAQALTPEVKSGLIKDGCLFVNVSGAVVAEAGQPVIFVPIVTGKEFILWSPSRGDGILNRAKPIFHGGRVRYEWEKKDESFNVQFKNGPKVTWHCKRFVDENDMDKWGSAEPGNKDSGIAATAHYNYVVALPDNDGMVVALSLSKSQVKKAKDLNALLTMSDAPMFSRQFTVVSVADKSDDGDFFNYRFAPAGFVQDPNEFQKYQGMYENFKSSGYNVDQSDTEPQEEASI